MAFDDALIGNNDFDPRTATEDLIRQQAGEPLPDVLDPRMLNTRLARKLGRPTPKETEQPSTPETTPKPKQTELDFSDEAAPPSPAETASNPAPDFSAAADDPNAKPASTTPLGITGNAAALGKGIVHGAIESAGGIVKGAGLAAEHAPTTQIEAEAPLGVDTLNSPWQLPGMPPKDQPLVRDHSPLTPAGENIKQAAQRIAPMTDQEKESLGGQVGTGIGTIAPYAVATAVNPGLGMAAGFSGMALDTYGQVYEAAKAKGQSDEDANKAANYSAMTAGVLGTLPLPAAKFATSVMGKVAVSGATFATLGEFQDAMLKEIAQHTYDPESGYSPDAKRIMAALIVGGLVGGVHAGIEAMGDKGAPAPAPGTGAPGPGAPGGSIPGPPPGSGGPRSSPEDIADFLKRAKTGNRTPHTESDTSGSTPPQPDPATMSDAELADAFQQTRDLFGGASLADILKQGGWMEGSLDHLDDRARVVEAVKIGREKAAGTGKFAPENQGTSSAKTGQEETGPQQEGLKPEAPVSHLEYAVLREYGYSDEDIGNMSAAQRKREVQDAYADGIKPGEAMQKHRPPEQAMGKTGAPVDRGGAAGTRTEQPQATGKRDEPIRPTTAEDVERAQPVEPKSPEQAQAENYQHAHIELPHLGLSGEHSISVETGIGQERHGVDRDGKEWSVKLDHAAYGRIKGTRGADGQPLDVFVGPSPLSQQVFVIDQHHPEGGFDEHKIMVGFNTPIDAIHAYSSSYTDHGKDRIGNVRALSVQEFKDWLKGDTTRALATPKFEKPPAPPVPADVSQHEGTGALSTEAVGSVGATPTVPKETPADATEAAGSGSLINTNEDRSKENLAPSKEPVEANHGHYDAIEKALGTDADHVSHVDIARAAEILTENEGMTPAEAFGQAVIENAVEGGFLTQQEAVQAYGGEVKDILESGAEGSSGGSESAGAQGAASDQERAGGTAQAGELPGGSKAGGKTGEGAERPASTGGTEPHEGERGHEPISGAAGEPEATEHEPTGGKRPARDKTGNAAEQEPAADAEGIDDRFAADRAAMSKFKKGMDVEFTQPGQFKQPDGSLKEGRLVKGKVVRISSREQGTIFVKEGEAEWYVRASRLRMAGEPEQPDKGGMLQDAGEKIGGARKDAWAGRGLDVSDLDKMTEEERKSNVTKGNVFKTPDWPEVVASGVDPIAAALMKRVYDRIPVKPNAENVYSLGDTEQKFITVLKAVRDEFRLAKTVDDVKRIERKIENKIGWDDIHIIYAKDGRKSPLGIGWKDERAAKQAVEAGFPNMEPWARLFEVREGREWGNGGTKKGWFVRRKNGGTIGDLHETKEAAVEAAKKAYDGLSEERKKGGEEPKRPHLDQIEREGPNYRKERDVTGEDFIKDFGFRGVEFGNWVASDERQKSVNFAYDALHDLARTMGVPPKALSLDGTLAVAFGARGKGGKAAAHYEPGRRVINLTKLSGAGTLAHEYGHALDHYLGWVSGEDKEPQRGEFAHSKFEYKNKNLPLKLRVAVNKLIHDFHEVEEDDAATEARLRREIESAKAGQDGWRRALESYRERKAKGGSGAGMKQAEDQIEIWGRKIKGLENQLAEGRKKSVPSRFLINASALSGKTGNYWKRPTELFARAFEAYVYDKIEAEGFKSQYLVQGVEPNRFGNGFRGNPYPSGEEREQINGDFDRVFRALVATEGKLGEGTKLTGAEGLPEPFYQVEKVKRPEAQPTGAAEVKAMDEAKADSLAAAFEQHFKAGRGFKGILEARKFAKEAGFADDPKAIEEAIEYGVVRAARAIVDQTAFTPEKKFAELRWLYERQPRLGTRTSTSVRDQAYSTPVPLAYLAAKLADITHDTTLYEPTAGNGALTITADPAKTIVNELNPERRANLREQGFSQVMDYDASTETPRNQIDVDGVDRVIANPPFGAVREEGQSKVFDLSKTEVNVPYRTHEIDHAIAIQALDAMKDGGKAALILGGVNKLVNTDKGRADAYQGKAKREFYKALYDTYNVVNHFTVNGDLYGRQGAEWPVDVIIINGRSKSRLPLPAVTPPPIFNTWDELGGLLNGQPATGHVQQAGEPAGGAIEGGQELAGQRGGSGLGAGAEQPGSVEPGQVRGQSGATAPGAGARSGQPANEPGGPRQGVERNGAGEQPAAVEDFDAAFDAALDDAFGPALATSQKPAETQPKREPVGAGPKRSTAEVAKETAKTGVKAADEAFSALYDLFGGSKASSGFTFDEDTYRKAKPHFEAAAGAFSEFKNNLGELLKRMVAHLRDAMKFTREAMERIKPYLKRFIDDMRAAPEAEPARKEALRTTPTETENQVVYKPQSMVKGLDTLIPVNMAKPTFDALKKLEERVGQIDTFVASELGYKPQELEKYFGAEQVDALALAIDNIKRGKGFIIGDQTGIGKGRVNAAVIRWAIKNGRVPVFVTEKPNLYKDIFRDLMDTGIDTLLDDKPRILATNAALNLPLEEGQGATIKTGDAKAHNAHLMSVVDDITKHYDMVVSTYNQMQTQEGKDTARRTFLTRLANRPNGIVILFDESHNAGGQKQARKAKGDAEDRAQFVRGIIQKAKGVFYSSATYAKRPDVMDLYAATDMAMAVDNLEDLSDAIARGGVPMQQAVAAMLSKAGQYIRRERSFDGINYNTPAVEVDRKMYDGVARTLSMIQDFSRQVASAVETMDAEIRAEGNALGFDASTGDAGAQSTNFTAVMHNVINQMLLAMKANDAADRAIEAIKAGEKPVLTVANTMEAFLEDYSDNLGLKPGDEMKGDFGHVLMKYLDRTRTVLIKRPFKVKGEKPIRHYMTDEELGPVALGYYNNAKQEIQSLNLAGLPLSPIDFIKGRLKEAGYDTGEITGRTLMVDYTQPVATFATRPGTDKTPRGRTETLKRFNTRPKKGGFHALIINQAGSTGLSAHASATFDDQSKRRMIIVQPEANIDTHMQLLGRINRTGQVVLPEYDQLVASIPAEKRPAAVLAKKMASLNANTTASRSSAVTAKDVPDFINQYGDAVAASWVLDNQDTHYKLASPVKIDESGKPDKVDAMRKLTGRIPLLRLEHQEQVYDTLETEYAALLAQLEAAGESALEAKSLDLKAKLIERMEVQGKRNNSGSPFAAPVVLQKVSIARLGKPYKPAEIMQKLLDAIGDERVAEKIEAGLPDMLKDFGDTYSILGRKADAIRSAQQAAAIDRFRSYSREVLDDIEKPEEQVAQKAKLDAVKDRWVSVQAMLPIGARVVVKTATNNLTGIVLDVKQQGSPKNPLALGSWKATFAIADASRQITLPFSRMFENGKADPNSELDVEIEPMSQWYEPHKATLDRYQHMQNEAREERWIAGGNILAGYDWLARKGAIINYTSDKGTVHQGILTARGFDPVKQAVAHGKALRTPEEIKAAVDQSSEPIVGGYVQIQKDRYTGGYEIVANKAKGKGGPFFLDKKLTAITGDFSSKGGAMIAYVRPEKFADAAKRLVELGAKFKGLAERPKSEKPGDEEMSLADINAAEPLQRTPEEIEEIKHAALDAIRHMLGDHVKVEFTEPQELAANSKEMWGGAADKNAVQIGAYYPWRKLIQLSLEKNLATTAAHEAYHAIEYQLQTPIERELMQRETPRIREWIKKNNKKYGLKPEQFDRLSGEEVRAIGFEDYAKGRMDGLHVGVKRWYHKLLQRLRRLANAIRELGYQTYEDIFANAYEGGFRDRGAITPRSEANRPNEEPALASIRPGGSAPPPMSETIAEHLRDRGLDRLAGLSKSVGLGKINTTEVRTKLQDKMIRVRNIEREMGGAPSQLSAYQAESLYYGRTGERLERLEEDRLDPLIKAMHDTKISLGDINAYLYARHAPERNDYIDTINPSMNGEGSGMSNADAAAVMASIPAAKLSDYQRVAAMVDRIVAETRDNLVSYGLISQDMADAWAAQYQHYVPLRGFAEGAEDETLTHSRFGGGYDTRGKDVKAALGRKSEADGPLQYVMMQAESAIVRGERNRVGNTFLRFVRSNPDPDRWQVNAPKIDRRIDPRTGLVTSYADFNYHNDPDAFVTKVGGKPMVIRLHGKDGLNIARALKQMGSSTMSEVVRALHMLTTLQARLSTQWNPNFTIPNFVRDLGEAFINLQEQQQQHFVTQFAKHVGPAMRGAFLALSGRGQTNRYAQAFREFDKAGGRIRFFGLDDPDDIRRSISRKMRKLQGGVINNVAGAMSAMGHAFEIVNGAVENAPRLAAFMAARDVGMSAPDAAMLARNLTVDFNKKGEWGSAINALYMFANANLQGSARLARGMLNKKVRRGAYALAAMGVLGALYNLLAGGDDDDGDAYYSKIKPYIRDKNMILMWPKGFGHDGQYIKLPLPYGFAPFHVIGDRALGVALGKDKPLDAAQAFLGSVADAFNPVGEESSLWMQMVPTILRPGLHIATNKNWTGGPIYPDNDHNKTRPNSEKSFRSNSSFSKWAAAEMNSLTGGSPYKAGWIDVHPGSIDHVLETLTGGLGKFIGDVVTTGGALIHGEPFDETHAPILRRFVGSVRDPASDNAAYYAAREDARKSGGENLRAARKDLHSGKNTTEAESFIEEAKSARTSEQLFKRADEQVKRLRAQQDKIEADPDLSREERSQKLTDVRERIRGIQNTARKRYKEIKEGIHVQ